MSSATQVQYFRWDDIPNEPLKGGMSRRFVTGHELMIAQVYFKRGDNVPMHQHPNEQMTYVISGALRFRFGALGDEEVTARTGEIVVIPRNLLHSAVALEDTFELDLFTPPRRDWLEKTDAYLRTED